MTTMTMKVVTITTMTMGDKTNMDENLVGKKAIVIVRGNPDDHNPDPIQDFINQHQIDVSGEWFYDWRSGDTDWAFRRYADRLGFSKGLHGELIV